MDSSSIDSVSQEANYGPLTSVVETARIETALRHLDNALNPKVVFSEDLQQMRKDAEALRVSEIRLAMQVLYHNVPGLVYRDDMYGDGPDNQCA